MEKKLCKKCQNELALTEFYKDASKPDGRRNECITCNKSVKKGHYNNNKDVLLCRAKEYREKNKDIVNKKHRLHYLNNKEKYSEYNKQYRSDNKQNISDSAKKYYDTNKDKILQRHYDNRESNLTRMRDWKKKNRSKLSEYQRNYYTERRKTDPLFKLRHNIATLIRQSLHCNGMKKNSKTSQILGCNFKTFKEHLESKFEDWMSWDNYGLYNGEPNYGWDIDHVIPSSSAINEEDLVKLNHFTNLQPLCSYNNRDVKKDRVKV